MKKVDKEIMKIIYYECCGNKKEEQLTQEKKCILNQYDILSRIPYKFSIDETVLDDKIAILAIKDYYECSVFFENGIKKYKFILLNKGKSFISQIENEKRWIKVKIILTISGPIVGFIISLILKSLKIIK